MNTHNYNKLLLEDEISKQEIIFRNFQYKNHKQYLNDLSVTQDNKFFNQDLIHKSTKHAFILHTLKTILIQQEENPDAIENFFLKRLNNLTFFQASNYNEQTKYFLLLSKKLKLNENFCLLKPFYNSVNAYNFSMTNFILNNFEFLEVLNSNDHDHHFSNLQISKLGKNKESYLLFVQKIKEISPLNIEHINLILGDLALATGISNFLPEEINFRIDDYQNKIYFKRKLLEDCFGTEIVEEIKNTLPIEPNQIPFFQGNITANYERHQATVNDVEDAFFYLQTLLHKQTLNNSLKSTNSRKLKI